MKHCEGIGPTPKNPWIFRCLFFCCYKPRRSPPWLGHVQPHPGITCRCGRTRCELGFTNTHTWWPGLRHRPNGADLWWRWWGKFQPSDVSLQGCHWVSTLETWVEFPQIHPFRNLFLSPWILGLFFFLVKFWIFFHLSNRKIHSFDAWNLLRGVFLPQVWCWNWNP